MCVFFAILILIPIWHSVCGQQQQLQQQQLNNNGSAVTFDYDAPDDCAWKVRDTGDGVLLACTLRTVNSEWDTTNFSAIPSEHTVSLLITCDPSVTARSSLENRSFAHLVRLRELELDACKLTEWPAGTLAGLADLRNLTVVRTSSVPAVESDNDEDAPAMTIAAGSFAHASRLERLDLSANRLAVLPANAFCGLPNLVHLNLSMNRIRDIVDLGFGSVTELAPSLSPPLLSTQPPQPPQPPQPLISDHEDVPYDANQYQQQKQQQKQDQQQQQQQQRHQPQPQSESGSCPLNVRTVDVSWNRIVALADNGFGLLRRLVELRLSGNAISVVGERPLAGLTALETLDVSCNAIAVLPADMFRDAAHTIRQIYLQNNSLAQLPPGVFVNLYQLTSLDLSDNRLTSACVHAGTFTGLIRLVTLNLANNRLSRLDPTVFHDLYTLQILNLAGNAIDAIPDDAFIPLRNLDTLIVSNNRIVDIGPLALNGLYALTLLSLQGNRLTAVHNDCFRNCTSLQDLNLSGNTLTAVPPALRRMRRLKTVDLGENRIGSLEADSFDGMSGVYGLRLLGNQIRALTPRLFSRLDSLQILNLAHNHINTVAADAFDGASAMQAIRLDGNRLSSIEFPFRNMTGLLWLNVSDNVLNAFDYGWLPAQLQWLDVHKNYLTELSNRGNVTVDVRTLDVRYNYLTYVGPATVPDAVEVLLMNDNRIAAVEPGTFARKANISRADMYANRIERLDMNALRLPAVPPDRPLPEFYIGGNPYACDCTMEWLQRIDRQLAAARQYPAIMDVPSVYCKLLYDRDYGRYVPLADVAPSQFVCAYKTHCFAVCQCCEFDACDCEMTCPTDCTCYHDQPWSTNIVDCYAANYTRLPDKIPMDATEVYLDGNQFEHLSSHALLGRKNLRVLFANASGIRSVRNDTFTGLKRLTVLHLERNAIERFDGSEFNTVENLRELYLQHNAIRYIGNRTFEPLTGLRVLRLDHNRLRDYHVWTLSANVRLAAVHLSENPWSCDCEFVRSLRRYLVTMSSTTAVVVDSASVTCRPADADDPASGGNRPRTAVFVVRDQNNTAECGSFFGSIVENRIVRHVLPAALTAVSVVLALALVLYLTVAYRDECRAWMYCKCGGRGGGVRICRDKTAAGVAAATAARSYADDSDYDNSDDEDSDDEDNRAMFDAYVAYSLKDDEFVARTLAPGLERGSPPGYRVGLHYRDFDVTATAAAFIAETVASAVRSSKRTVLVVSKNFLESEWCRFKSALHAALRDKRGRRLIVVALGQIRPDDVDPELRAYMNGGAATVRAVVDWGDRMFWEKLKYAMPDVGECRQRRRHSRRRRSSSSNSRSRSRSRRHVSANRFRNAVNVYATPLSGVPASSYSFAGRPPPPPPPPTMPASMPPGTVPAHHSGKYYLSPAYVQHPSQRLWT